MSGASRASAATRWSADSSVDRNGVRIMVVDTDGKSVQGALAGDRVSGNYEPNTIICGKPVDVYWKAARLELPSGKIALLRFIRGHRPIESGADGAIDIPASLLTIADAVRQASARPDVLYLAHPGRRIGAVACCSAGNLGAQARVTLQPLCHVRGQVIRGSEELLPGVKTFAFWEPVPPWPMVPVEQFSAMEEIDMFLPPGRYVLESSISIGENQGRIVYLVGRKAVVVKSGMTELSVNVRMLKKEEEAGL